MRLTSFLIIFPSSQRGGVEEYGLKISKAALEAGWEVYTAFPDVPELQALAKDFSDLGASHQVLSVQETNIPGLEEISTNYQSLLPILANLIIPRVRFDLSKLPHFIHTLILLLRIKPGVVMVNLPWHDYAMGSILACACLKIPTVVNFHLIPNQQPIGRIKSSLYKWAYRRQQKWIGISQSNCRYVAQTFHIPEPEIHCIYNGIDIEEASPESSSEENLRLRNEVRQELSIPQDSVIVLTVARLSSQKGHDFLIPAISHLIRDFPHLRFIWIGDGERKQFLQELVESYGVTDSVLFLGHRRDVPRFLSAADIFVLPTYYEGQPFALLEAMAYGLPAIATAVNGIPEVVEHKIHGLLTRKGDSCDLLEAIRWALRHRPEMEAMAQKAKLRVREFSQSRMLKETLALLSDAALGNLE